ncbi:MAG: DUF87 domain-containing protein [Roseitalea porphyridii]|uniref:ATP-binding protein n=1 Tax=Roseitalea porphyridii TaxID=1852022 RepID=UPI0032D8F344
MYRSPERDRADDRRTDRGARTSDRRNRTEGHVIDCDGTRAVISAIMPADSSVSDDYWNVGSLITIASGPARTVGMLYRIEVPDAAWRKAAPNTVHIHVELVGEIREDEGGAARFAGGLSHYPHLGAVAHRIRNADLQAIFANTDPTAVPLGRLSQSRDIEAMVSIDAMISRHFAVVGTTGVGKSTTVSLLIRKIVAARPDIGILLLDPHNEFATAFPDIAVTIDDSTLDLPFWLFRLEEFVEVLFRGRPADPEEVDILRDLIPEARLRFKGDMAGGPMRKPGRGGNQVTADTPVPYRVADLLALIKERMGSLDAREHRTTLKSLASRIEAAVNDPRYRFMFAHKTITDNLAEVLAHIYRVPSKGRPVTIFQLNGIPSEVVNAVVSVLCRVAFELSVWSRSKVKTLVLCEEAHRYIPADREAGFGPTRASIARIAKEGRKYGVSLGIITQRPSELDATILSQCNTIFAMRLGNDSDQDIIRRAITGASRSYINFLPSLANREAIAFGQGVNTPMRMIVETVDTAGVPGQAGDDPHQERTDAAGPVDMHGLLQAVREPVLAAADALGEPLESWSTLGVVGEQRPSLADAPKLQESVDGPVDGAPPPGGREGLFTYDGPLRRNAEGGGRSGRTQQPNDAPQGARDLISRFRRADRD